MGSIKFNSTGLNFKPINEARIPMLSIANP